jgi:hypothetical protein
MHQFTDRSGRRWLIQIDVSTIKRVRSLTGVNLLDIVAGELIERLSNDPLLLADVLYAVVQPQAADPRNQRRGIWPRTSW